jgi:TonB family protein
MPEGQAVFEIHTDEQGHPIVIEVVCSTVAEKFTKVAEKTVRKWRFKVQSPSVGQVLVKFSQI